jgi:hypothetical protein
VRPWPEWFAKAFASGCRFLMWVRAGALPPITTFKHMTLAWYAAEGLVDGNDGGVDIALAFRNSILGLQLRAFRIQQ